MTPIEQTLMQAIHALHHNHRFRTANCLSDPEWPRNGFYIGSGAEKLNLDAIAACQQALYDERTKRQHAPT